MSEEQKKEQNRLAVRKYQEKNREKINQKARDKRLTEEGKIKARDAVRKHYYKDITLSREKALNKYHEQTKDIPKKKKGVKKGSLVKTTESLIEDFKEVHGEFYDYSKVEYSGATSKVTIICPIHGEFNQNPYDHKNGTGCKKCAFERRSLDMSLGKDEFIRRSKEIHGNFYDYSKVEYFNEKIKVTIVCPIHGEFLQAPFTHTKFESGCPKCSTSKGEKKLAKLLDELNIKYIPQYKTPECFYKNNLPFDFFLYDYNTIIEFDGIQHHQPTDFSNGKLTEEEILKSFELIVLKDKIKDNYCKEKNIKMVRIPYWKINNINKLKELIIDKLK